MARQKLYYPNWIAMLEKNKGFIGPWCTDGACAPLPPAEKNGSAPPAGNLGHKALGYNFGGPFPGLEVGPYGNWAASTELVS